MLNECIFSDLTSPNPHLIADHEQAYALPHGLRDPSVRPKSKAPAHAVGPLTPPDDNEGNVNRPQGNIPSTVLESVLSQQNKIIKDNLVLSSKLDKIESMYATLSSQLVVLLQGMNIQTSSNEQLSVPVSCNDSAARANAKVYDDRPILTPLSKPVFEPETPVNHKPIPTPCTQFPQSSCPNPSSVKPTPLAAPRSSVTSGINAYNNGSNVMPVSFKIAKQQIPIFEAKCSLNDPMKRQDDFEQWIRKIEIVIPEGHDETRIKVAKIHCQGHAETIVNSGQFAQFTTWNELRLALRDKFGSSEDFFRRIESIRLKQGQSPKDFHIELAAAVLSGEDGPLTQLVTNTERIWHYQNNAFYLRERRLFSGVSSVSSSLATANSEPYCAFHRSKGHLTKDCRGVQPDPGKAICDLPTPTNSQQVEDSLYKEIIDFLEGRSFPKRKLPARLDEFDLIDGVLYHVKEKASGLVSQLCIPLKCRLHALDIAHNSKIAGHPGTYRTYRKLQELYYFPCALSHTRNYVSKCLTCKKRKAQQRHRATLADAPLALSILERVSMDLVELPKSDNDFKYVLVIVDQLSRFTQLVPLKDKQAVTFTNTLINDFITIFGPPQAFICDNGTEFSNSLLRAVCKLLETKINFTTPYHPESNGLCERTNRIVKDTLYALTEKNLRLWDTMIPHVRFAINSSVNRSVNNQPLYLMLEQSIHYPVGLTNKLTVNKPANERFAKSIHARDAAVLASKQCRKYNKDYVARKSIPATDLDVGSLILRKSPSQKATGLTARWTGPLRITKRTGPVTYLVKDLVKNSVYRLHRNDMLSYEAQDELEIVSPDGVLAEHFPDDPLSVMMLSLVRRFTG
ncbi:uncharacterized protein LOC134769742 [Penaeus indicus]|uniref:uncharacterized protein LOC134769742 n=1 Tax=Penaeus indicus TaxID=29960 RepID=UPI00300CBF57